jgi:hypothetical protein
MSSQRPNISDIGRLRDEAVAALTVFFSTSNVALPERLLYMTTDELKHQFEWAKDELDNHMMMGVLATLEAHFRDDFEYRCAKRLKDDLSRSYRDIRKKRKKHVRLEDDILEAWKKHHPSMQKQVSEIKSVLKLRHWLAHGRHWIPKLGRNFDFMDVERLALDTLVEFNLY